MILPLSGEMRDNVAMPPISPEQLDALPPEIRAVVQALIDHYEGRLGVLRAENEVLRTEVARTKAELAAGQKNSRNSSKPPSTEHPHAKPLPPAKPQSQRPRGGQPGHEKHERALIPAEECSAICDHRPKKCRGYGGRLSGTDPVPLRHQVWELPE